MNAEDKTLTKCKIWWKIDEGWEEMSWYRLLKRTDRYTSYLSEISKERDTLKTLLGILVDKNLYGDE